jgi:hypothetical protein
MEGTKDGSILTLLTSVPDDDVLKQVGVGHFGVLVKHRPAVKRT